MELTDIHPLSPTRHPSPPPVKWTRKGVTPKFTKGLAPAEVEKHFNCKGVTPWTSVIIPFQLVEKQ